MPITQADYLAQITSTTAGGTAVPVCPVHWYRWKEFVAVILISLLVPVLNACSNNNSPLPLVGTLERDRLELVAEARESINEILVTEGQTVVADQLLASLDRSLYESQLAQLQAAADGAEQFVAELVRGPRKERIVQAKARVEGARAHVVTQRKEYERISRLRNDGLVGQADLDRAQDSRKTAQTDFEQADATLQELLAGTTGEEIAQARAHLNEARAAIETMKETISRLEIRAPRPGRIESLPYEVGERPPAGAPVVVMLADSAPYARVYIPEPLRARITPGLAARIHVDGIPDAFAGEVRYVANEAAFTPYYALTQRDRSRLAFPAEITLTDSTAADLPSGVPVEVNFPTLR